MTSAAFEALSVMMLGSGLMLWFWGSWPLLERQSLLVRLHKLTMADSLGSLLMMVGLLMRRPDWWPLFSLAILGLLLWSTIFGYVVAAGTHRRPGA